MKSFKKVLFAVLSFVLLFGVSIGLASCDKDKKQTPTTTVNKDDDVWKLPELKLDLKGQEVIYYTHVLNEDDPGNEKYDSKSVKKEEFKEYIKDIEKKYNFKLKFESYDNNRDKEGIPIVNNFLKATVVPTNKSALIRLNETQIFMDNIKAGSLVPFTKVLKDLGDDYVISPWQKEKGTVMGEVFALQKGDAVTYPDLLVFNRTLLKSKLGDQTVMPDQLWEEGKWTFEAFKKMLEDFQAKVSPGEELTALGLTPYFLGVHAVNANGVGLVDNNQPELEDKLRIDQAEVIKIINQYKELYTMKVAKYYLTPDEGKKEHTDEFMKKSPVNKNHFSDSFKEGKYAFAGIQNWQADGIKNDLNGEFSIVPYPQNEVDIKKYKQPIEAGDVLCLTKGENSDEVAKVLLLINRFYKYANSKALAADKEKYGLDAKASDNLVLAHRFVEEKTKNTTKEDIDRAVKIAAYVHGYDDNNIAIAPELATIAADNTYAFAIQQDLYGVKDYTTAIGESKPEIVKNFKAIADIVATFK